LPMNDLSGLPNLSPTIVTNYELGWDRALPSVDAQFRASAFSQRSSDVLSVAGGLIITPSVTFSSKTGAGGSPIGRNSLRTISCL
jgi:hypothetical protein